MVFVVEMKEASEAATKGVLLGDRLHQINGVPLALSLGHKHVRERVVAAKRPMHLILERMNQVRGMLRIGDHGSCVHLILERMNQVRGS
jgi:hypothetical protein